MNQPITIVNRELQFKKVSLIDSSTNAYFFLAAEIDRSILPVYFFQSQAKRELLAVVKEWCSNLEKKRSIISATVFTATLIPPGKGEFLKRSASHVKVAKYDVAILIEASSLAEIKKILDSADYQSVRNNINKKARAIYHTIATNVKRINSVDHRNAGIFLFNYFYAANLQQNLAVWEYTAGWFQEITGLDNSTVWLPTESNTSMYTLINHCRWDKLSAILPALLFNKTFRTYVLANFYANNVAAMPILYTKQ